MGLVRRPATVAEVDPPVASTERCEACRRSGVRLESRNVEREVLRLCIDPVACRLSWEVATSA